MRKKDRKPKPSLGSLSNSRTYALYRAGLRLLADSDCDEVSVAQITRAAECSVGAFYERFSDKNSYLIFLIRSHFQTKTNILKTELPNIANRNSDIDVILAESVSLIIDEMSGRKIAGVIRAALKLASTQAEALAAISDLRDTVNALVFEGLKPKMKTRHLKRRIEGAMQMIFAVIFDALQQNHGPLKLNGARMSAILTRQTQTLLFGEPENRVFDKKKSDDDGKPETENQGKDSKPSGVDSMPAIKSVKKRIKRQGI
jgi:AcrR family transcriptional regulator